MRTRISIVAALVVAGLASLASVDAQETPSASDAIVVANPDATFPAQQRALPSPAVIREGDGLYQVNCQACHGADLRGGDQGGPNLLRSDIVLNDVSGELIAEIVSAGRNRMPGITSLDRDAVRAIAGYIHSVVAKSERQGAPPPVDYDLDIVVGDARAGARYFERECTACHSATGDLSHIANEIPDPVDLQNSWVAGKRSGRFQAAGGAVSDRSRTRVTVTLPSGEKIEGELVRYDDFFLSLVSDVGGYRSFTRRGDTPAIAIRDPLARHNELLGELTDETMHDVTAYLETLK
jgi:cytochrome c oxidase cbb3-type subunit 3